MQAFKKEKAEDHIGLVWHVVHKFDPSLFRHHDQEDLFQVGCIGLVKACNHFDPERKIKFGTFATRCIANEILMVLRKEKLRRLESPILYAPLRNQPDYDEELLLIDTLISSERVYDELFAKELLHFLNQRDIYASPSKKMRERDRQLVMMRLQDCTQLEIAEKLNMTQSYVSRRIGTIKKLVNRKWGTDVV